MLDASGLESAADIIEPGDFYIVRHGWIFEAMLNLQERGDPVEYPTVCSELKSADRLEPVGGYGFVQSLVGAFYQNAAVRIYAQVIREAAMQRRLYELGRDVAKGALNPTVSSSQIVERLTQKLTQLALEARHGAWEWRALAQACEPKPPRAYVVLGLLPLPSLSVLYGAPGTLKTMLMQDLALCVATGKPWLKPVPGNPTAGSFLCEKSPVLFLDVDNGWDRTERRFAALCRGHNAPTDAELSYVSFPKPAFIASDLGCVDRLVSDIQRRGARLVVIDNLGAISGGVDENSAQMIEVMQGLRCIAERANVALVVIHHKSKGARLRIGDSIRGHSSIEAALDLALRAEREDGSDTVILRATKTRDAPIGAVSVEWSYERVGTELLSGGFLCLGKAQQHTSHAASCEQAILDNISDGMNQSEIVELVKQKTSIGRSTTLEVLKRMVLSNRLYTKPGPGRAKLYFKRCDDGGNT